MENRDNFLNALKIESQNQKSAQKFTSKKGTLSKIIGNHKLKLAAGLMAVITPFIISGCSGHVNTPTTTQAQPSTTMDNESKPLSDKDSILQDFKQIYIDEYNKINGTNFGIYDIKLYMKNQDYLYVTKDNQYVTHGSYPDKTKKILNEYGLKQGVIFEGISDSIPLIQVSVDGNNLESAANFYHNHNSISTTVLSGNSPDLLTQLKEKKGLEKNTLCELYNAAKAVLDLHNTTDQNSKKIYVDRYYKAISEWKEKQNTGFGKE